MNKDASIQSLLTRLDLPSRRWRVLDYWEADLFAVGLTSDAKPMILVYVSAFGRLPDRYDYVCEDLAAPSPPLHLAAADDVEFEELVRILCAWLN